MARQVFQISANDPLTQLFELTDGYKATATVSGQWVFDPGRAACGAAGVGGPTGDPSFPRADAPIGCLWWNITPGVNAPRNPWDTWGWFTNDNQTIVWGGTSPGSGKYSFQINDDNRNDNSGSLTLTVDIEPKP